MRHAAAVLCLAVLAACGNPKDAEGWAKRAASRSRLDEKLAALAEVRKTPGDRRAEVGGQAVLGRQGSGTTPWLTERHGYDTS